MTSLNEQFGIDGVVEIVEGKGGFPVIEISNSSASATINTHGGHIMAFQPVGEDPVLWMSEKSLFEAEKPIRGGVPVCWPWFGSHPTDEDKPAHGFVRRKDWEIREIRELDKSATYVVLGLCDDEETRGLWPYSFDLAMEITVGRNLDMRLVAKNTGEADFTVTAALHTYFTVADVQKIAISGLDGVDYFDSLTDTNHTQQGPITFDREVDRVYLDTPNECVIEDSGLNRKIKIAKTGSKSCVVWNPWIDKSKRMPDFGDEEYPRMVCVETTNALNDNVTIPAGGSHTLQAVISVE